MGAVIYLDFKARQLQSIDDQAVVAIDDSIRRRYLEVLRIAVGEELKLHSSDTAPRTWRLSRNAKARLGSELDNKFVLETTMRQLRHLTQDYGVEVMQRLAEQTVYKDFLRLTLVSGEVGVIAVWRHCPR